MTKTDRTNRVESLVPILSVSFIGSLGFSIVMPFLVFLVTRWGGNAVIFGVMGATYSIFQLIGAPILGRWSDKVGRRKVLLVSQVGTAISWLIFLGAFFLPNETLLDIDSGWLGRFSLTIPLVVLFIARAADGITGGNVSVASAYLADVTHESKRNENFGKLAIATNLGFIFGPALAGLLAATGAGEILPVIAALVISVVASVMIATKLPESKPCVMKEFPRDAGVSKTFGQEHKECFQVEGETSTTFKDVLAIEKVPTLLALYFLIMLAFNLFYVSFPVYAAQSLHWTISSTGLFFTFMSVLMVLVQGPVLKWASGRWSERRLIMFGSLSLAIGFASYSSSEVLIIYLGTALLALGNGLMWSSLMSVLSVCAGKRMQGAVQGYAGSAGAVASILGLIAGGLMFKFLAEWTFVLAAGLILAVFVLSFGLRTIGTRAVA